MAIGDFANALMGPQKPSVSVEVEVEDGEYEPSAEEIVCASEQIAAMQAGDAKRLARANRTAFAHYEAMPHVEGPHE